MARQEARLLQKLQAEHVVRLLDAFEDDDNVYLVLELLQGQDLSSLGPISEQTAQQLIRQLLVALDSCHRAGVVHRDLKPENLMVDDGHLTLIDFGLSLAPGQHDVAGTRGFLAPECMRGHFGPSSDLFACGRVLERLLVEPSAAAAEFLAALLHPDADKRPSALGALKLRWLQQSGSSHESPVQKSDASASTRAELSGSLSDTSN